MADLLAIVHCCRIINGEFQRRYILPMLSARKYLRYLALSSSVRNLGFASSSSADIGVLRPVPLWSSQSV